MSDQFSLFDPRSRRWLRSITSEVPLRFLGRSWPRTSADVALAARIRELVALRRRAADHGETPLRLVTLRDGFRRVIRQRRITALLTVLRDEHEPEAMRLAIWQLGRIRGTASVLASRALREYPDARVRREVVRALKRCGVWWELEGMQGDSDAAVQELLRQRDRLPLEERMARLFEVRPSSAQRLAEPPDERVHWLEPPGEGKPPKPIWLIRAILYRIHLLVHGEPRSRRWFRIF